MQLPVFLRRFGASATWATLPAGLRRLLLVALLVHALLCGLFIHHTDFTSDESDYFGYAVRWAQGHPERVHQLDDSKSPIVAPSLWAVPFKQWLQPPQDVYGHRLLQAGRVGMYVYAALLLYTLACWMHRWRPGQRWWWVWLLCLFDPLLISYSMLVGSDLPVAALLLATCYCAWRYWHSGEVHYWWRMGLLAALAMVAKASMVYTLPMLLLLFWLAPAQRRTSVGGWLRRWAGTLALVLLVINAAYYFKGSFFRWQQLPQTSQAFQRLAAGTPWLQALPVPLPYAYVSGFDALKKNAEFGGGDTNDNSFSGVYVAGHYQRTGPVWYYYLVMWLYKWPLLCWLLLLGTLLWWLRHAQRWQLLRRHAFLWFPPLFFGLVLSFTNPFQIGIRHSLLLLPFLYLLLLPAAAWCWQRLARWWQAAVLLHALSLLSYWPNMIAYTNELWWPKAKAFLLMNDSSISYGNSRRLLTEFLRQHPRYRQPGATPVAGLYAIDIERLGTSLNTYGLDWLRNHCEPAGHYRHTVILYHITPQDVARLQSLK